MELKTSTAADVAILTLSGRFDAYKTSPVIEWLETTVRQSSRIVVDLANVSFVDSSGLAALVQGMKRCRQRGGDLRLCQLQQPVSVIFQLTRLDNTFEIYPTLAAAVTSFERST